MASPELLNYFGKLGFDADFLAVIEREKPSLDLLNGFIFFAEKCRTEIAQLNGQMVLLKLQQPAPVATMKSPSSNGDCEAKQAEIDRLRLEIEENRTQLAELVRLRSANEKMAAMIEERDLAIKQLEINAAKLNNENEDFQFGLQNLGQDQSMLGKANERLKIELDCLRKIADRVRSFEVGKAATQKRVAQLEAKLARATVKIDDLNRTIIQLKSGSTNVPMCVADEQQGEEQQIVETKRHRHRRHRKRPSQHSTGEQEQQMEVVEEEEEDDETAAVEQVDQPSDGVSLCAGNIPAVEPLRCFWN